MLSEQTQTQPQWADLSGRVLEGGYEIEDLLEADRDRAKFKIRVLGDRSVDAFVHLLRTGGTAADERLALWDSVHKLSHPNLHVPLAAGRTELEGVELIYTVLRKPDETLSGALRNRALNAKEAGEVLVSIARALERLHENRLLHGCVSPEQIVAFGDSIQLTSECVRPINASNASQTVEIVKPKYLAPESSGTNTTPAADVWCLGATLFEVLTQKDCGAGCLGEADALPMPFSRVAQRCLASDPENRCTLSEAMALYKTDHTPKKDHSAAPPRPTRMPRTVPELARIPEVTRATPQARERTTGSRAWIAWVVASRTCFLWCLDSASAGMQAHADRRHRRQKPRYQLRPRRPPQRARLGKRARFRTKAPPKNRSLRTRSLVRTRNL